MKIEIRNFRGVSSADIHHEKLTLIGGKNHNGKSSICEAIAAVFTGEHFPIEGILKKDIKLLVRDGAKEARCEVHQGDVIARIKWPEGPYYSEGGEFKHISRVAAGFESLLDKKKKERGDFLAEYVKGKPTLDDLEKELKSHDFNKNLRDKLKDRVKASGFQGVWAKAKETGARLKGQWEEATRERFGEKKMETWYPNKWYVALGARTLDELTKTVNDAKNLVEAGIAAEAVSGLEVGLIEKLVKSLPALKKDFSEVGSKISKLRGKQKDLNEFIHRLKKTVKEEHGCPHCGGLLCIEDGKIIIHQGGENDRDLEHQKIKVHEAEEDLSKTNEELLGLSDAHNRIEPQIEAAEKAKEQLERIRDIEKIKWEKNLEEVRKKSQAAEDDLDAFVVKGRVDTLKVAIKQNKIIIDILSPEGLRAAKMRDAIVPFNDLIGRLCRSASWGDLRIGADFEIRFKDRLLPFCSMSEKFQAKIILQLAMSATDEAPICLIDGAEIIVGTERNGLMAAILESKVSCMIFMSMKDRTEMPPMEKIGGSGYWIEKGELQNGKG